ncbi:MAG: 1,2-phenylacetyl-CoA epoxidase subunit PaaE [Saprospiraceae bacterium]
MAMPKFHALKISDIRQETADAVSIAFDIPESLKVDYQFIQGQYLTMKAMINGEEIRRNYSVCVSPLDQELRVAIKKVEGGRFSTFANETLAVGDTLDVMTPMGKFYSEVKATQSKNYVGFAGGSGITPIISIMKTVLQVESTSQFTLFYANKGFDSIIFREEIEALKNTYIGRVTVHHIFSQENLETDLFNGYITTEKCRLFGELLFEPIRIDEYFICGPEPMMLSIRAALEEMGVAKPKIHIELFSSPDKPATTVKTVKKDTKKNAGKACKVSIRVDGDITELDLAYDGESILDAALKKGADLPFACKGGVCCTCRAKVVEGEVEMDVNYALEEEEVAAGFILTCQAHPRTDKVFIDFDQK